MNKIWKDFLLTEIFIVKCKNVLNIMHQVKLVCEGSSLEIFPLKSLFLPTQTVILCEIGISLKFKTLPQWSVGNNRMP